MASADPPPPPRSPAHGSPGATDVLERASGDAPKAEEDRFEAARRAARRPPELSTLARRSGPLDRIRARIRDVPVRQLAEGIGLCLVGVGLLLGWAVHLSWTPMLDVALVVVGLVLVVQSRLAGPSRPLMALGVVLAAVSVATWQADVTLDGGLGRRREAPVAATGPVTYRLGTGELIVDLRETALTAAPLVVRAEVGVGRIVVRVPDDAVVTTRAVAGAGQVLVFGRRHVGPGVDETAAEPALSRRHIRLDLHVGLGSVEVERG